MNIWHVTPTMVGRSAVRVRGGGVTEGVTVNREGVFPDS